MESLNQTEEVNPASALPQETPEISEKSEGYRRILEQVHLYIRVNGLAQTLVFLKNEGSLEAQHCLGELSTWLQRKLRISGGGGDFTGQIMQRDSQFLRIATREILSHLESILGKLV